MIYKLVEWLMIKEIFFYEKFLPIRRFKGNVKF